LSIQFAMPASASKCKRLLAKVVTTVLFLGCQASATPSPTPAITPATPLASATQIPSPTITTPATPLPTATFTPTPLPPTPTATTVAQAPVVATITAGAKARYRVKEQFARQNLPNVATGETEEVSGSLVFDSNGILKPNASKIVINVRSLRSDDSDRDDYLRTDGLETDKFQQAEFVASEISGLSWPLPTEGQATFQIIGTMTAHGVSSPTIWDVSAQFNTGQVRGQATTSFTFSKFNMRRPTAFFLLSVEDKISLELDFMVSVKQGP